MANEQQDTPQPCSEIIFYQTEGGHNRIEVRLENETVWLTQQLMAELFQKTIPNLGMHSASGLEASLNLSPSRGLRWDYLRLIIGDQFPKQAQFTMWCLSSDKPVQRRA